MAKTGWAKPPTVIVVAGSNDYLRRREIQKAIRAAGMTGRRVEHIDGGDREALSEIMDSGVLFADPVLVIIANPEELDAEVVKAHRESKNRDIGLVLLHTTEFTAKSAMGKLVEAAGIPKRYRLIYKAPAPYKMAEAAAGFIQEDAKGFGITVSGPLAEALVAKVGTDYGVLHFELLKVAAYMKAVGEIGDTVKPPHLKATMSLTGEAAVQPIVDAVGRASPKNTLRAMGVLKANAKDDPTLLVCAWLGNQAVRWLHASALVAEGADAKEASSRIGVHPFVYDRFVLPVASRWGGPRLRVLVENISIAERAIRSGHINPWVELECGLVRSCRAVRAAG